jgi:hypothetical protein
MKKKKKIEGRDVPIAHVDNSVRLPPYMVFCSPLQNRLGLKFVHANNQKSMINNKLSFSFRRTFFIFEIEDMKYKTD